MVKQKAGRKRDEEKETRESKVQEAKERERRGPREGKTGEKVGQKRVMVNGTGQKEGRKGGTY